METGPVKYDNYTPPRSVNTLAHDEVRVVSCRRCGCAVLLHVGDQDSIEKHERWHEKVEQGTDPRFYHGDPHAIG